MQVQFPTQNITVVPQGFKWTVEAAEKAARNHNFIRVGGPTVTTRVLSGAVKRSWKKDDPKENNTIFVTDYRITGTEENIRAALEYAGYSEQEINKAIANAITKNNYQTIKADEVNQELADYEQAKEQKPQTEPYSWENIRWFANNIKFAVFSTKSGEQHGALAPHGHGGDTLAEKVQKLTQGKVIDVSGMDFMTGKGARTMPMPKTGRAGKFGSGNLPFISNDVEKYRRAIEVVYGAEALNTYAKDISYVDQAIKQYKAAMKVPAATKGLKAPAASPKAQGATLAPQVQFKPQPLATPQTRTLGKPVATGMPKF